MKFMTMVKIERTVVSTVHFLCIAYERFECVGVAACSSHLDGNRVSMYGKDCKSIVDVSIIAIRLTWSFRGHREKL